MNERIEQLAIQVQRTEMPGVLFAHPEFVEKFAELIVRECADTAYQSLYEDRVFDDTPHNIRCHVVDAIKKHFGVEE
jgi:hypothetical protein